MQKIRMFAGSTLLAGAIAVAPAQAEGPKTTNEAVQAENTLAVKNPDKVKCKKIEVIGKLIPERVCRTNAEWAVIARNEREEGRAIVDMGNRGNTNGR